MGWMGGLDGLDRWVGCVGEIGGWVIRMSN